MTPEERPSRSDLAAERTMSNTEWLAGTDAAGRLIQPVRNGAAPRAARQEFFDGPGQA